MKFEFIAKYFCLRTKHSILFFPPGTFPKRHALSIDECSWAHYLKKEKNKFEKKWWSLLISSIPHRLLSITVQKFKKFAVTRTIVDLINIIPFFFQTMRHQLIIIISFLETQKYYFKHFQRKFLSAIFLWLIWDFKSTCQENQFTSLLFFFFFFQFINNFFKIRNKINS